MVFVGFAYVDAYFAAACEVGEILWLTVFVADSGGRVSVVECLILVVVKLEFVVVVRRRQAI